MKRNLLSVARVINMINPELTEPQISVVAVNLNREELEKVRKRKGISVRTLERKINLSKSRYYRWLQYQVDLPMELIIGLKKVLAVADYELLDFFESSTDEQIQMLSLMIYTSMSDNEDDFSKFLELRKKLEKYRIANDDNIFYKLLLAYSDIVVKCYRNEDTTISFKKIEDYFLSVDYFTLNDIILYLATVRIGLNFEQSPNTLNRQLGIIASGLLKKIAPDTLKGWRDVIVACVIDLTLCLYDQGDRKEAIEFLNKGMTSLTENGSIDEYQKFVLEYLASFLLQEVRDNAPILKDFSDKLAASAWCLPKYENFFWQNLALEVEVKG